jgi:hypothetical protein
MDRNFRFDGATIVLFEGRRFDLHNDYDLVDFGTDLSGDEATLRFVKSPYAFPGSPDRLRMICRGNLGWAFSNLISDIDNSGFEMAYFDRGLPWNCILTEDLADTGRIAGLHIDMQSGAVVRIFCDVVEFVVEGVLTPV